MNSIPRTDLQVRAAFVTSVLLNISNTNSMINMQLKYKSNGELKWCSYTVCVNSSFAEKLKAKEINRSRSLLVASEAG